MHRSLTLIGLFVMLFLTPALSQGDIAAGSTAVTTPTPAPEAPEEAQESRLPFDVKGALDVYYQYNFRGTPFPTSFTETVDGFSLGMANLMFSREGKVGFMVDVAFGPRAEAANGFEGTSLSMIKQLFVTYSPTDWLKFTAGNFSTFVGYEVIDAPVNINYSTSYMFSNGPFFHTGIKADIALGEHFGLMGGLFDDTDSKFDFVPGKHVGAQLSYKVGNFSAFLNFLSGKAVEADSIQPEIDNRQIDLVATLQVSEKLGLGLNATQKTEVISEGDNANWRGAALYANYAFSDLFTLGLRGEFIDDPNGLILGLPDNSVLALTLSGNFHIGGLTIIPEFRLDNSSLQVFPDNNGEIDKALPGFLVAAVYSF